MSKGPNRQTESYKAQKRIRDARYRKRNYDEIRARKLMRIGFVPVSNRITEGCL